jgi:alcohol dehydrogenase class IV
MSTMVASSYDFLKIDRVTWSAQVGKALRNELDRRSADRALVVASPSLWGHQDVRDDVEEALATRLAGTFTDTVPHVPRQTVVDCRDAIVNVGADVVVTLGGGTPIDTVKMALLVLAAGHSDFDALTIVTDADGRRVIPEVPDPPLRQVVVPTTLSGAEFSDLGGCVDPATAVKQLFSAPLIGSATVIYDPALARHTPQWLWLSTGVRALDHAIESLCSTAPNAFTDATAVGAIALLARSLPITEKNPDDLEARSESQQGVWLACAGLNRVPWGASHGIGHQLGAVAGVPHGYCSCVMLPHVLRDHRSITADRQRRVAEALGAPDDDPADTLTSLVAQLGLPGRLRDVGVTPDQLPLIAERSLPNMFVRQNPRPLRTVADVLELLERAY